MTTPAFERDLSDLQRLCSELSAAIDTGDADSILVAMSQVASAWRSAKTTLEWTAETGAHAINTYATHAHVALCTVHGILGPLFQRARAAVSGGAGPAAQARATLYTLAAALDLGIEPDGVPDAVHPGDAVKRPAAPGARPCDREAAGCAASPDAGTTRTPLIHVRALDAFEAFYRQLAVVLQRTEQLGAAFDAKPLSSVVSCAADLNSAWSVVHARLELLKAVTNDDAGRELRTLPTMRLVRERLDAVLRDGAAYVSRHPDDGWPMLMQLRQLEAKLISDEAVAATVTSAPSLSSQPVAVVVVARPDEPRRARCRTRVRVRRNERRWA
jgi:hypothetical protein